MDDKRDTPTEKIDGGDKQFRGPSIRQGSTPTEKADPSQQWQSRSSPPVGSPQSAAETEMLDRQHQPATFAWLVILTGSHRGEIHRLSADVTSIGRDASNSLRLSDEFVSRQHAKVRAEEDDEGKMHFYLYDLASSAGIFVNGERVYRHELLNGDRLQLGQTQLVFKRPDQLLIEEADDI